MLINQLCHGVGRPLCVVYVWEKVCSASPPSSKTLSGYITAECVTLTARDWVTCWGCSARMLSVGSLWRLTVVWCKWPVCRLIKMEQSRADKARLGSVLLCVRGNQSEISSRCLKLLWDVAMCRFARFQTNWRGDRQSEAWACTCGSECVCVWGSVRVFRFGEFLGQECPDLVEKQGKQGRMTKLEATRCSWRSPKWHVVFGELEPFVFGYWGSG